MEKQNNEDNTYHCIDCSRYGDLHSSCYRVRDLIANEDDDACEEFKLSYSRK